MKRIQLVVFDLDGTIIDSEWAHEVAKSKICKELGVTQEIPLSKYTGRSNRLFWTDMLVMMGQTGDVEELVKQQFAIVLDELHKASQLESAGLTMLLQFLKEHGITLGVSSGSEKHFIQAILDYLNISEYFDFMVTGNDIVHLKPAPDIYLAALKVSKIQSEFALALEDSKAGCQAAKAAGLLCIGYSNHGNNPQNLSDATYRIDDMREAMLLFVKQEEEEGLWIW